MSRLKDAEIAIRDHGWKWVSRYGGRNILCPPEDHVMRSWTAMWDEHGIPHYLPKYSEEEIIEPGDGVFATPTPKHIPRYDVAGIYYYCKERNIEPKEMSPEELKIFELIKGIQIAELIFNWADKKNMHPDDFSMLFADELIEKLREDK